MSPAGDLRIDLFGELRVRCRGRSVVARLPGRQGRALLAYLVLNHRRPVDRDELLDVLWSASPPADPDAALSSVLAKVRRAVGPDLIKGRRALTLQLADDAEVDVQRVAAQIEQAERALAAHDAATALCAAESSLSLLAHPLLPGLQGDWVDEWRRHFEGLRPRALEATARAALSLGGDHLAHAERAASALVEIQPFRESAYALLMQAQALRGDVPEAMRTFERLRTLLRDELGTTPSPEFVELHGRLLNEGAAALPDAPAAAAGSPGLPAAVVRSPDEGAFVGRAECLKRLRDRWERTRAGHGELVVILGEPGVGKTRLVTHFAYEAHAAGAIVLCGRADEDALLPHQPFVEALRPLLAAELASLSDEQCDLLGRLSPDLVRRRRVADDGPDRDTLRYRLFQAVVDVLARAGRRSPVVLLLDDLHWADKPTLLLLRHLMRSPELGSVLVLATARDQEPRSDLDDTLVDIRRDRNIERIRLDGLAESETGQLAEGRLGRDVTPGFVARLCEQTAGNPFFIEETLRALQDADLPLEGLVDAGSLDPIGVPDGVADVILRRWRRLSPLAADALVAAAVVGRRFRLDIVAQLVDAGAEELILALEESIDAGLIRELSGAVDLFAFAHVVVREVLYEQLTASRRVRLHHRVATGLERLAEREPVNPAELALHYRIARHIAGSEPALRYEIAAGARAGELLAYEEAAGHYRHALDLLDADMHAERCDVELARSRAMALRGRPGPRDVPAGRLQRGAARRRRAARPRGARGRRALVRGRLRRGRAPPRAARGGGSRAPAPRHAAARARALAPRPARRLPDRARRRARHEPRCACDGPPHRRPQRAQRRVARALRDAERRAPPRRSARAHGRAHGRRRRAPRARGRAPSLAAVQLLRARRHRGRQARARAARRARRRASPAAVVQHRDRLARPCGRARGRRRARGGVRGRGAAQGPARAHAGRCQHVGREALQRAPTRRPHPPDHAARRRARRGRRARDRLAGGRRPAAAGGRRRDAGARSTSASSPAGPRACRAACTG